MALVNGNFYNVQKIHLLFLSFPQWTELEAPIT